MTNVLDLEPNMNGPIITIWFMDDSSQEVRIELTDVDAPKSWSIKNYGLVFHYHAKGQRLVFPWHNIRNFLIEPRRNHNEEGF